MNRTTSKVTTILLAAFLVVLVPSPVQAYFGPGAGIALGGSFLAVFAAVFSAAILLLTWPVRMGFRAAFGRKPPAQAKVERVVILGLDGLDHGLTEKLLAEGKLPHLARLRDQGGFQALGSTLPPITPVAWSTFQTGVNPGKHNIFDFLVPDEQTYRPKLSSVEIRPPRRVLRFGGMKLSLGKPDFRLLRKSQTFWSILSEYGIFNCIIRVPITFPPEKLRGVQLSAMCVPDLRGTQGVFSRFTTSQTCETANTVGETIVVVRQDASIRAELVGPPHPRHAERSPLRLPFTVTIKDQDHAVLKIQGTKRTLHRGEYSDWIHVSFSGGWGVRISGVCKFLWSAAEPDFELYVTPLNIDPEKPAMRIGYPAVYPIYLAKRQGAYATLGLAEDTWGLNEHVLDDDSFLQQCLDTDREREAMFFDALDKVPRGLCVCVFDASDRLQHMFWRYLDEQHPSHPPDGLPRHRHAIDDLYQRMDQLVGRTMAKCDQEGTLLMVLSDHGFDTFRTGIDLNRWLEENGYLKVDDARRNDEHLAGVDWSQTRAFALGLTGIFLNLRDRFSQGIVDSGSEAEQLRDEIVQRLSNLTEPASGGKAIKKIYQATQVYRGPYKNQAPDLIVGYERGFRVSWESAAGRTTREVFHANTKAWSGDHCVDPSLVPGVLFCNRPLLSENPRLLDIAPTVLDLFGIAAPAHMDGKALVIGDAADAASETPPLPANQVN